MTAVVIDIGKANLNVVIEVRAGVLWFADSKPGSTGCYAS
jgi:hypothetical protein